MDLETTLELESCKSRLRFLFFAFAIFMIAVVFFGINVCVSLDKLNGRVQMLEQQHKAMQDKSAAEFDDLNDQINGLYKRVQVLEEDARKNSKHIWL